MIYKTIIVDTFNVLHKIKGSLKIPSDLSEKFVNYVNNEIMPRFDINGTLWFLFDPIVKTDMNIQKYFSFSSTRQILVPTYKTNRTHSEIVQKAAEFLLRYYSYKGLNIKCCVNEHFEADDFVETILKQYPPEKADYVALCSNDLDWGRYLTPQTHMIDINFNEYKDSDWFLKKYKYLPTIASVTFDKAFFGDKSDNIQGAIMLKKLRDVNQNIKQQVKKYIKQLAITGESLDSVVSRWKGFIFNEIINKTEKTFEEQLWLQLTGTTSKENVINTFFNNVRVIQSRCTLQLFQDSIVSNEENKTINNVLDKVIGRGPEAKKTFKFGGKKFH